MHFSSINRILIQEGMMVKRETWPYFAHAQERVNEAVTATYRARFYRRKRT